MGAAKVFYASEWGISLQICTGLPPHYLYRKKGQGPNRAHLHSTGPGLFQTHLEYRNTIILWDVPVNNHEDIRDDADVNFVVRFPEWFLVLICYQVPL